ncbi:uncharacterized protein PRCAT00004408001 [Priceomyces carsonii]|uniref:uncharacterized protein n=1 Tax=Priceomyces carsonii TaxID=28549 RepID=UPI002ED7D420|nr:unnamed protein product [Priceomyces carsonii]
MSYSSIKLNRESEDQSLSASQPQHETGERLVRLEIESSSTSSVPISLPYAYIMGNSSSFDTVNMLMTNNETPRYSNTSRFKDQSPTPQTETTKEAFNQVPKRFSHFIDDQRSPTLFAEWDDLTIDSSIKSNTSTNELYPGSSKERSTPRSWEARSKSPSDLLSRDLSKSMSSQATIFSTRPDSPSRGDLKRKKGKTAVSLYSKESRGSELSRKSAIRFKQGSWLYRLRIRLRKLFKKFRAFRFNNFKASSKKSSIAPIATRRRNSVLRKASSNTREGPNKRSVNQIVRSKSMSSKIQTGQDLVKKGSSGISFNTKLPDNKQYIIEGSNSFSNENSRNGEEIDRDDETGSIPPPPPPHLVYDKLGSPDRDNNDVVDLWRNYLSYVVCKRIQLRQEIYIFQQLAEKRGPLVFGTPKGTILQHNLNNASALSASEDSNSDNSNEPLDIDDCETRSTSTALTETDNERVDEFVDPPAEEFTKSYINRRSVLGDMLDYDSDMETSSHYLSSSSKEADMSYSKSVTPRSSIHREFERYGTLSKRNGRILGLA